MRIAVVCNDTRGGVQPYVALALGLQKAGHEVCAVAPGNLAHLFAEAGVPVAALSGMDKARQRESGVAERGTLATMRMMAREMPGLVMAATRETLAACEGVDVMTGGVGGMVAGLAVAEKLGVPFVASHLQPIGAPSPDYPGVLLSGLPGWVGGWGRQLSHRLSDRGLWLMFGRAMAQAREQVLGLTGRSRPADPRLTLYGLSRHAVPVPEGDGRHVTGYWTLPAGPRWTPPPALRAFLERPGPVVSVGFGSMSATDPEALRRLAQGAARDAGVHLVLLAGWTRFDAEPDGEDVLCVEDVPHDWLFPRMAAVVHHGGAGTTGAALGAGVANLVVPFGVDQPFWGTRVAALGVGPAPVPRRRLTRERLAEALVRMLADDAMQARAAALGAIIRAENGAGTAAALLGRFRAKAAPM